MQPQAQLVILAALLGCALAFPRGAMSNVTNPMDALSPHCTAGNYRPEHGDYLAQATYPPFHIKVVSPGGTIYKPNQVVTIKIEGVGAQTFKGFFLLADNTAPSFAGDIVCPGQGHKVNFCGKQGATHSNPADKLSVECKWTPPDFQVGSVNFVATIVANFSTFWTGVKSEVILTPDPTTMTYTQKSIQLRENMMRQFQQSASGLMSMFGKQTGNQFGAASGGQGNSFSFGDFGGSSKGPQSLASLFEGGQSQPQDSGNMWTSMFKQNNNGASSAGLPSQFQQFFQNA